MKRTSVRVAALTFALGAMLAAPAAAVPSHQLPGSPTVGVTAPGEVTPQLSPCQVVPWWFWCR